MILQLLAEADAGERHLRIKGIAHAVFGSGTLMSVAGKRPLAPRPVELDAVACDAFLSVFNALREKQHDQEL